MDDMIVDEGGGGLSDGGGSGGVSSADAGSFAGMVDDQSTVNLGPGALSNAQPTETVSELPGALPSDSWAFPSPNQDGSTSILSPGAFSSPFASSGSGSGSIPTVTTTITYDGGGGAQGSGGARGTTSSGTSTPDAGPTPAKSSPSSGWAPTVTSNPPDISLPPDDPGDDGSPAADPGADPGDAPGDDGSGGGGGGGIGSSGAATASGNRVSSQAVTAAVTQYYQQILGRAPDAGGLANDTDAVLSGSMTLPQVRQSIADSQEARNDLDGIISDVQGRQATAGDQPWIQQQQASLAGGSTLADIRQSLADFSGEAGVITSMYQAEVGRAPSAAEISATEAQLAAGASLQSIRTADASSPEAVAQLNQLYQNELGRQADAGGLASYESLLASGGTLAQVAQSIGQSQEAESDLEAIISDVQGRQATAADQPWIQAQQAALTTGSATLASIGTDLALWTADASAPAGPVGSFPSMQTLTSALLKEYQDAVDEGYEAATEAVADDEANGTVYSPLARQAKIGQLMDASARADMKDWLTAQDIPEGKAGIVQINRRLYAEDGSGFRIPDIRVANANIIFDASLTAKNWTTSQVKDFVGTGGTTVVIVRPTALGGSYSVIVPKS